MWNCFAKPVEWDMDGILISKWIYRKLFDIRGTLAGNEIVDHSDVVGGVPTSDAPTTSEWSTISFFILDLAPDSNGLG